MGIHVLYEVTGYEQKSLSLHDRRPRSIVHGMYEGKCSNAGLLLLPVGMWGGEVVVPASASASVSASTLPPIEMKLSFHDVITVPTFVACSSRNILDWKMRACRMW
jgi:hypothetical protein